MAFINSSLGSPDTAVSSEFDCILDYYLTQEMHKADGGAGSVRWTEFSDHPTRIVAMTPKTVFMDMSLVFKKLKVLLLNYSDLLLPISCVFKLM